jgi:hypothetical protein
MHLSLTHQMGEQDFPHQVEVWRWGPGTVPSSGPRELAT